MNNTVDDVDLEKQIVSEYKRKLELGRKIKRIIEENSIPLKSLDKEQKEAIELYHDPIEVKYVEWRPWQKMMMEYLHNPTQKEVIWVVGENGNEGKSFFQDQIEGRYGKEKVCKFHFGSNSEDLINYLHIVGCMKTDIFLLHTYRRDQAKDLDYRLLEIIKEGRTISTQYGNNIHLKSPNIIIVFSNMYPDFHQINEEKWKIFKINRMMELKEVNIYTNRVRINNRMKMIFESDDEE